VTRHSRALSWSGPAAVPQDCHRTGERSSPDPGDSPPGRVGRSPMPDTVTGTRR